MTSKYTICKESPVPVYQQLIEYFEDFIENSPSGTKLLPERELAKSLDVSRNSLRQALEHLYERGLIVRHRRNGTFTAPKTKNGALSPAGDSEAIHPMAYYNDLMLQDPPSNDNILTLALFENIPCQKEYWEKIVKKFTRIHPEIQVIIEWLPQNVKIQEKTGFDNYFQSIQKEPDLIQCSLDKALYDSFAPLPEDMINFLTGSNCFHESLEKEGEYLLSRMVPIYTAVPICVWNADMAKQYEITDIRKRLEAGSIIELSCSAAEKLPVDIKASGPLPNLMRFWGHPENLNEINHNTLAQFFVPLCREIKKAKCDPEKIFSLFFRNYPIVEKILAEEHFMNFYLSNTGFMPLTNKINFNNEVAIFPVQQPLFFESSSLAVSKSSRNKKAAYDFLAFMLSHEIQSFTTRALFAKPFIKLAMPELYRLLNSTPETIDTYLDRIKISCKIDPSIVNYQVDYISYSLRALFEQILKRETDGNSAAETALDIWSKFLLIDTKNKIARL